MPPAKNVAVVACMDARLKVSAVLGLDEGDAHIIRNAGGIVSQDALRSLVISQHLLGTTEAVRTTPIGGFGLRLKARESTVLTCWRLSSTSLAHQGGLGVVAPH